MELKLDQQDLEKINQMIMKTPFEFAYPLFQYLRAKIAEQTEKENRKPDDESVIN